MVALTAFAGLVLEKTNTASSSCVSLHFLNFVIAIIHLGNVYQSAAGKLLYLLCGTTVAGSARGI